jgi:integrase
MVISMANKDTPDYLWTIFDTAARVSEINRLTWQDIDLSRVKVTPYTRKKKGGNPTPRQITMTNRLVEIMARRFEEREGNKPWVFWHRYWDRKAADWAEGPYNDRKGIMKSLCARAQVRYLRFHALRHLAATLLDQGHVPTGTIQKILGHENRTTTEIYLHSVDVSEHQAMSVLDRAGKKSHKKSHIGGKRHEKRGQVIYLTP